MTKNLTNAEKQKIIEKAVRYGNSLHQLMDKVGRLDDLYESPLIDSRMPPGAYQYIQRAIGQLEGYIYEIEEYA